MINATDLKQLVREAVREELEARDRWHAEIQTWWHAQKERSAAHIARAVTKRKPRRKKAREAK